MTSVVHTRKAKLQWWWHTWYESGGGTSAGCIMKRYSRVPFYPSTHSRYHFSCFFCCGLEPPTIATLLPQRASVLLRVTSAVFRLDSCCFCTGVETISVQESYQGWEASRCAVGSIVLKDSTNVGPEVKKFSPENTGFSLFRCLFSCCPSENRTMKVFGQYAHLADCRRRDAMPNGALTDGQYRGVGGSVICVGVYGVTE